MSTTHDALIKAAQSVQRQRLNADFQARQRANDALKAKAAELAKPSDGFDSEKKAQLAQAAKAHAPLMDRLKEQQRLVAQAAEAKLKLGIGDVVPRHEDGVLLPEHRLVSVAEQMEAQEAKPTPPTKVVPPKKAKVLPAPAAPAPVVAAPTGPRPPPVVAAAEFDLDRDLEHIAKLFGKNS